MNNVNTVLRDILVGSDVLDQKAIDDLLIKADGSANKSIMGANAILGCSMAVFRASSLVGGALYGKICQAPGRILVYQCP